MSNVIKVECTHCFATFGAKSEQSLGKTARCPKCSKKFVLQAKEEPDADPFLDDIDPPRRTRRRRPSAPRKPIEPRESSEPHERHEPEEVPLALARPQLRRLKKKRSPSEDDVEDTGGGLFGLGVPQWAIGGILGSLLGVVAWVSVGYLLYLQIGWIAIGMGFMVGFGVRVAAGEDDGIAPGITAAVITIVAILLSKFLVAVLLAGVVADQLAGVVRDVEMLAVQQVADKIVDERINAGEEIDWPENNLPLFGRVDGDVSRDYPPEIWEEAQLRFEDLPDDEQKALREAAKKDIEQGDDNNAELAGSIVGHIFVLSFSILDFLWIPLAAFTAFQLGANVAD